MTRFKKVSRSSRGGAGKRGGGKDKIMGPGGLRRGKRRKDAWGEGGPPTGGVTLREFDKGRKNQAGL